MDVVIPVRTGDLNEELRHALRGIAQHVPHGRVWLAGHRPPWVSDEVGHIRVEQAGRKWANARANRLAACRHPEVGEDFALFNDDFFVMQPIPEIPVMHRGPTDAVIADYQRRAHSRVTYTVGMVATTRWLQGRGIPAPLSYELHAPLPVTKTGFGEVLELADRMGVVAPHVRTMFGNLFELGGVEVEDFKIHDMGGVPDEAAVFVSTTDTSFARGAVGQWVRERLDQPCRYER